MLNLGYSTRADQSFAYSLINWEEDIADVAIEQCSLQEDSFGYRVVYYGDILDDHGEMVVAYVVGASLLPSRLRKLSKAGFDAPMTQRAMEMIESKSYSAVAH